MIKKLMSLLRESLYKNAFFIMLNSVLLSGFGFLFWLAAARLYTPEQVGFGSTLLSALELITSFALLGLNIGIVRFLPKEKEKGVVFSTYLLLVISSAIFSILFAIIAPQFIPSLSAYAGELQILVLFAVFVVCYVLFTITDSVFIALRRSKHIAIKGAVFSILKLTLLFVMVPFGMYSIFISVGISALAAFVFSSFFLGIRLIRIDLSFVRRIFRFSFANYIAQLLETLPGYLMPIFIAATLGTEDVAFFYIAFMISSIATMLPKSMASSLLAEGAHDAKPEFSRVVKNCYKVLLPIVFVMIFLGKLIFSVYGRAYGDNAYPVFVILALSSLSLAPNVLMNAMSNIKKKVNDVIMLNSLIVVSTFAFGFAFLQFRLIGFGIAYLLGQLSGNIFVIYKTLKNGKK